MYPISAKIVYKISSDSFNNVCFYCIFIIVWMLIVSIIFKAIEFDHVFN